MVGGDYLARDMACAAMDGRIAVIGLQSGEPSARIDITALMVRRLTICGATLRAQPVASKGRLVAALRSQVWPLFQAHDLRLPVHARFPLAQAASAHALMEAGSHIGKLVLTM
jgi:NADPH2:quinone reductase